MYFTHWVPNQVCVCASTYTLVYKTQVSAEGPTSLWGSHQICSHAVHCVVRLHFCLSLSGKHTRSEDVALLEQHISASVVSDIGSGRDVLWDGTLICKIKQGRLDYGREGGTGKQLGGICRVFSWNKGASVKNTILKTMALFVLLGMLQRVYWWAGVLIILKA